MTSINNLSSDDALSQGDLVPVYSNGQGVTRKATAAAFVAAIGDSYVTQAQAQANAATATVAAFQSMVYPGVYAIFPTTRPNGTAMQDGDRAVILLGGVPTEYVRSSGAWTTITGTSPAALAAASGSALVGFLQSGTGAIARTVQDKLREAVSVLDFGAVGNGVTDDTVNIQKCWDYCKSTGKRALVPNRVFRIGQTNVAYGMEIVGEPGATFKLLDNMPSFTRMLTTENNYWANTSPAEDSPPLILRNLILDGNQLNQGPYTGFQKEQQGELFLAGSGATNTGGFRLRAIVENCLFKASCGDGISVFCSTDVAIINCFFWNDFRGSVTVTGGNNRVRVANVSAGGNLHNSLIHIEVDSPVNGVGNVDFELTNSVFKPLDGDPTSGKGIYIGTGSSSTVNVSNCYFGAGLLELFLNDATSVANFSNCTFRQIMPTSDELISYGIANFNGCTFIHANNARNTTVNLRAFSKTGLVARFIDCEFRFETAPTYLTLGNITAASITTVSNLSVLDITLDAPHGLSPTNFTFDVVEVSGMTPTDYNGRYWVRAAPTTTRLQLLLQQNYGTPSSTGVCKLTPLMIAIHEGADDLSTNNHLHIQGCTFSQYYTEGFKLDQGGAMTFVGNSVNSFCLGSLISASSRFVKAKVNGNTIGDNCRFSFELAATGTTSLVEIDWGSQRIPVRASGVRAQSNLLTGLTSLGERIVYDALIPLATMARLPNDLYVRTSALAGYPNEWAAITLSSGFATAWSASRWSVVKGAFGTRPTLTTSDTGVPYLDTTLAAAGKLVTWTGTAWVDATGTVV